MKKKFLTGMLLGTLALSATPFVVGCSDDDDISRLEEQMATNQNTATVDKNELLNLINETKAALEEQLELAVSGKADSQEVIDLQAKVTALTEQLNAASEGAAEQITSLIEQINGLVADVNKVSGDLDAQKVELEGEIAAVKEALDKANADNSASTQDLKDQLASAERRTGQAQRAGGWCRWRSRRSETGTPESDCRRGERARRCRRCQQRKNRNDDRRADRPAKRTQKCKYAD